VFWGWRCGNESLDPSFHLSEIDSSVAARPIGELHRQAEHWKLAGDVPQARHHVTLARDRHDGAWTPLANDAARELAARRHEHRNLVASRDLEHAVERLFR